MEPSENTIDLLHRWSSGDPAARDLLFDHVYDELRALARRALRHESPDITLQPTALVHEACIRLLGAGDVDLASRAQFFALAATVMRHILVDHARARLTARRGAGAAHFELGESDAASIPDPDVLAIDQALHRLEALDPRKCRVVEMKFFAGYTEHEIASILGVARATVERDWTFARSWLQLALDSPSPAS
ncbi:MAG: ECF-type sigma factor [Bryobacteraceae bacterium]|nr:sigma-70 family RNA polymerase sigma factor [Solibacteraceae bacterium]MCL4844024.1 sigma-70 family RNA polymerase sigma factor [Bryobacteraceae bacterium]MCO5352435.1 ECF-type sigma factor [Bryobacteraceae bacterium]